jgi:hypothetical protein
MDTPTAQLSPYNSAQSHYSFCVGLAPTDLSESIHDLLSPSAPICPLETHDGTCLVMIVIIWEGNDPAERMVTVRVTKPTSLPFRHQRDGQTHENSDGVYSYIFSLNMMPGMNYIVWCSSSPFNLSESLSTFAYGRPNIWLVPSDPSSSLLFYSTNAGNSPSSTSPYHPIPPLMVSSFSPLLQDSPPQIGLLFNGVPSLLTLSRLASGPLGLLHPTVGRIYPWLLQTTTHYLITPFPSNE